MMRTLLLSFMALTFLMGCKKEDSGIDKTKLSLFLEPFFEYEAPRSTIINYFGDDYTIEPTNLPIGHTMVYEANLDGFINYSFTLNDNLELTKTKVRFHSGKANRDFIYEYLSTDYTKINEQIGASITTIYYENMEHSIELSYHSSNYSDLNMTYRNL